MQTQFVTSRVFIKYPSRLTLSAHSLLRQLFLLTTPISSRLSHQCTLYISSIDVSYFSGTGNSRHHDAVYLKLFLFLDVNILFVVVLTVASSYVRKCNKLFTVSCFGYKSCNFKGNWQNVCPRQVTENEYC
jgi:hypothetical protein